MNANLDEFDIEFGLRQAMEDNDGSDGWRLCKSIYIDYDAAKGTWIVNFRIHETQPFEDDCEPHSESRTEAEGPFDRAELEYFLADMRLELDPHALQRLRELRLIYPKPTK